MTAFAVPPSIAPAPAEPDDSGSGTTRRTVVGVLTTGLGAGLAGVSLAGCTTATPEATAPGVMDLADQLWGTVEGLAPTPDLAPLMLATATQRILGPGPAQVRALAGPEQLLFVLPGRRVVAFGGFLAAAPDPGLVVAAIARGQAHLDTGAVNRRLAAAVAGEAPAPETLFGLGGFRAPMLAWSAADEEAAELAAVRGLAVAGYDPRLTRVLWQRLEAAAVPGQAFTLTQMRPGAATASARSQLLRSLGYFS